MGFEVSQALARGRGAFTSLGPHRTPLHRHGAEGVHGLGHVRPLLLAPGLGGIGAVGQLLARLLASLAGLRQTDLGIHPHRQQLLFAAEAVGQAPVLSGRGDMQVHATAVGVVLTH